MSNVIIKVAEDLEASDPQEEVMQQSPNISQMPEQRGKGQVSNPHQMIDKKKVVQILESGQISNLTIKEGTDKTSVSFEVERPKILRPDNAQTGGNVLQMNQDYSQQQPQQAAASSKISLEKTASVLKNKFSQEFMKNLGF